MLKCAVLLGLGLLALPRPTLAQAGAKPVYMQIFYEGASWTAGRPVLHYSPAFQGKTGEVVVESDSTKSVSPGALTYATPPKELVTTVGKDGQETTYARGQDGKMRLQPPSTERQKQAAQARFFNLLDTRARLAQTVLLHALNATAAEGWEVVQMSNWGAKDGLVYLLRRR